MIGVFIKLENSQNNERVVSLLSVKRENAFSQYRFSYELKIVQWSSLIISSTLYSYLTEANLQALNHVSKKRGGGTFARLFWMLPSQEINEERRVSKFLLLLPNTCHHQRVDSMCFWMCSKYFSIQERRNYYVQSKLCLPKR